MDDRQDNATRRHTALRRFKQISLQVITDDDQIPGRGLDGVFALLKVGDSSIHGDALPSSAMLENLDGGGCAIYGCHLPALACEPECISPRATREVKRLTRRQWLRGCDHEPGRRNFEIFRLLP